MRTSGTFSRPTYTVLHLGAATADGTPFGERTGRLGGAVGTTIATHAILVLAVWFVVKVQPAGQPARQPATVSSIPPLVFRGSAGEGSGRSAGGNRSTEPAARIRTRGADAMAMPTAPPPAAAAPTQIAPEREPTPVFSVPVRPMNAGELPQVGTVDGVPGPPADARGPGERGIGSKPGDDRGLGNAPGPGIGDGPYGVGNGVTPPDLIYRTQPQYTAEAMRAKMQGVTLLSGVVGVDGTLRDIRVARSLDGTFGLDQEAIRCVRQWRFRPGMRQGRPVAVYVTIEVAFTLR